MTKDIKNLSEQRNKSKPRSLEDAAKAAVRRFCDPDILNSTEEPEGLASGKTTATGSFVHADEDTPDGKDTEDEKNKTK